MNPIRIFFWLRFILWLSVCALIGVLLAKWTFGQMMPVDDKSPTPEPGVLLIAGGTWGNAWMTIHRADTKAAQQRGFDPSYTYIIVDYKPMVKKLANGKWAIQFTSEIAEDLP